MIEPVKTPPIPAHQGLAEQTKRCAVYARVSVADAHRGEMTSIEVQIEACLAYIASQRGLGWAAVEPAYKDEGVSGGTLQRPALRALLDDVRQGKIDVVVAHRIDRFSRSLFDLCDLIALLDVQRVQLVSVTQPVDTSTPWGRLSLHLLTSFAEFERQLIGERTRDKLAATRAAGRWQGQGTPLGYGVDLQQRLVVVYPEAATVRRIFHDYLHSDSMAGLMERLHHQGIKTKRWVTRSGTRRGGELMDRTSLYRLLNNRMYIGEALFHGEWHSGVYPPIVDLELWSSVQAKLSQRARRKGISNETRNPLEFPLIGKVFWHDDRAYTVFKSSARARKLYRYYLAPGTPQEKASDLGPFNLPTQQIHQIVIDHLRERFRDPEGWMPGLLLRLEGEPTLDETAIRRALKSLDAAWPLFTEPTQGEMLFKLISRVTLYPDQVGVQVNLDGVVEMVRELDRKSTSQTTAVAKQPKTRRARG